MKQEALAVEIHLPCQLLSWKEWLKLSVLEPRNLIGWKSASLSEWHAWKWTVPALNKQQSAIPKEQENQIFKILCYNTQNIYFLMKKLLNIQRHKKKVWSKKGKEKEKRKYGSFKGKKNMTETIPEEAQMLEWLVKDIESAVFFF